MLLSLRQLVKKPTDLVFFSTKTVWWTTELSDLKKGTDLFGFPVKTTNQGLQIFDEERLRKTKAYGKYPLTCLAMAHARNLQVLFRTYPEHFPGPDDFSNEREFVARIEALVEDELIPNFDQEGHS